MNSYASVREAGLNDRKLLRLLTAVSAGILVIAAIVFSAKTVMAATAGTTSAASQVTSASSAKSPGITDMLNADGDKLVSSTGITLSAHQFAFPIYEGKFSIWTATVKDESILKCDANEFYQETPNEEAQDGFTNLGTRCYVFTGLKSGDTFVTFTEYGLSGKLEASTFTIMVHVDDALNPSWSLTELKSTQGINYRPEFTISGTTFTVLGKTYDLHDKNSTVTKILSVEYVDSTTFLISAQTTVNSMYVTAFDTSAPNYTSFEYDSKAR